MIKKYREIRIRIKKMQHEGINMKITNEKFEKKIHIHAIGKGEDTLISLMIIGYSESTSERLTLSQAESLKEYLILAIENYKKRVTINDDEDE